MKNEAAGGVGGGGGVGVGAEGEGCKHVRDQRGKRVQLIQELSNREKKSCS